MSDGGGVSEGPLRDDGDIVPVEGQDPQVLQTPEGVLLDALELVVGHDEGGEPREVGEDEGRQDRDLVVAEVSVKEKCIRNIFLQVSQTREAIPSALCRKFIN